MCLTCMQHQLCKPGLSYGTVKSGVVGVLYRQFSVTAGKGDNQRCQNVINRVLNRNILQQKAVGSYSRVIHTAAKHRTSVQFCDSKSSMHACQRPISHSSAMYEDCKVKKFFYCLPKLSTGFKLSPPWRILFFGTDEFSLVTLKALNENR